MMKFCRDYKTKKMSDKINDISNKDFIIVFCSKPPGAFSTTPCCHSNY